MVITEHDLRVCPFAPQLANQGQKKYSTEIQELQQNLECIPNPGHSCGNREMLLVADVCQVILKSLHYFYLYISA